MALRKRITPGKEKPRKKTLRTGGSKFPEKANRFRTTKGDSPKDDRSDKRTAKKFRPEDRDGDRRKSDRPAYGSRPSAGSFREKGHGERSVSSRFSKPRAGEERVDFEKAGTRTRTGGDKERTPRNTGRFSKAVDPRSKDRYPKGDENRSRGRFNRDTDRKAPRDNEGKDRFTRGSERPESGRTTRTPSTGGRPEKASTGRFVPTNERKSRETFARGKNTQAGEQRSRPGSGFKTTIRSTGGFKEGDRKDSKKRSGFKDKRGGKRELERGKKQEEQQIEETEVRLNRYIANAGVCSRREADDLIGAGLVSVNGKIVTEMGYKVAPGDDVRYNGERLSREKKVYLIMNKPKDALSTTDDPEGRRTIMDVLGKELGERVYPIGRLDRNTTGILMLTNDGELAQRLMHPKYEVQKVYKATLNKKLKGEDLWQLSNGVDLEDGFIKPDGIAFPDPAKKEEVGIEIHSGRNRIIHRMFEHLGYLVDKLDRVAYAGFTKKALKRGEWRYLTDKELREIKRIVKLA